MTVSNISDATSIFSGCISTIGDCVSDSDCLGSVVKVSIASLVAIGIFKCTSYYCCKHTVKKWTTEMGNELTLVRKKEDLHWEILVKSENKKYTTPAVNDIHTLETYAVYLRRKDRKILLKQSERIKEILEKKDKKFDQVKWLREHIPLKKRISFYKENNLQSVAINLDRPVINLVLRRLPSFYGGVDVPITIDTWAVTIICRSGKEYQCDFGHTVIAYEGVVDGYPFVRYAHLVEDRDKPGFGKVLLVNDKILDRESNMSQSTTWPRPSYKVRAMVERIESDIEEQDKGNPYTFSAVGSGGLLYLVPDMTRAFSRSESIIRENCHSWATRTLKEADIEARRYLDELVAVPAIQTPFL